MRSNLLLFLVTTSLFLSLALLQNHAARHGAPTAQRIVQSEWRHYTMDEVGADVGRFEAVRGRYLQVMRDLEGKGLVESRGYVHIEVDQAVHSGSWKDHPEPIIPWREPGLVIDWKIQNSLYNAYDRVLTDSRMSTIARAMPAGPYGLITGATLHGEHSRVSAPLDGGHADTSFAVTRQRLPHGAVNVLTLPYVLSAMHLQPGDRFTLPGFALIGGPSGTGRQWRGAFEVKAVTPRAIGSEIHEVTEVVQWLVDPSRIDSLAGSVPAPQPGQRFTRHLVSDRAPYFIGRRDYLTTTDGQPVPIREQVALIDWAPIPLPTADLIKWNVWSVDSAAGDFFQLKPEHIPQTLVSWDP